MGQPGMHQIYCTTQLNTQQRGDLVSALYLKRQDPLLLTHVLLFQSPPTSRIFSICKIPFQWDTYRVHNLLPATVVQCCNPMPKKNNI